MSAPRHRVPADDGHELLIDEFHRLGKEIRVFLVVGIQTLHQLLTGMNAEVAGNRDARNAVECGLVELEGTLVAQLVLDASLHLVDRALRIDVVVKENRAKGFQGLVGYFLERAITIASGGFGQIRRAGLEYLTDPRGLDTRIVQTRALAAQNLTVHRLRFIHKKHDDMEHRLAELRGQRSADILVPEGVQFLVKKS